MDPRPLRELAGSCGISIGSCPDESPLKPDPAREALHRREFDSCVFNAFHWCDLQPHGPDAWDWRAADAAVLRAERAGQRLRAHSLLWHEKLPAWLPPRGDAAEIERRIRTHVSAVVTRYRGRVASWDVVNEPAWAWEHTGDGLRSSLLHRHLGERYIDAAFLAAREADPDAELVLNEALLVHRDQEPQRQAFLRLVERLVVRGVPVDAAGIQGHLFWDDLQPMGPLDIEATVALTGALRGLGVRSLLTELDVFDAGLAADTATRDRQVADIYGEFLRGLLPEVSAVLFWGFADPGSWYNTYVARTMPDRLPRNGWQSRPLLFDAEYRPKPAYFAVARALEGTRVRAHGAIPAPHPNAAV